MSEDEQSPAPKATPDDYLDEFVVDVPSGDGEKPMTLRELREAVEDESHPRHAEAVQRNKELAKQLRPAIDRIRQTVMEQSGMREHLARIQETVAKTLSVSPINSPKINVAQFDFPKVDLNSPVVEQLQHSIAEQRKEFEQDIDAVTAARDERLRLEDQRARQMLDVLASIDAYLAQLNDRIKKVDTRIEAGNVSSSKAAKWTIIVAVLTLLATVASIVVTVLLSR